ncbi:MAG TPA: hypothetical protein VHA78_05465 [Candidatus Peribacteraceae bacterium]|nr:hypothetical protein [Candidatus Peribacteraceae bacterium]
MSEMHQFIVKQGIENALPQSCMQLLTQKRRELREKFTGGFWYPDSIRQEIRDLNERGYYAGPHLADYRKRLEHIFREPESNHWSTRDASGTHEEPLDRNDILLVGGVIAADILEPDEFWAEHAGFTNPADLHGVIGALALRSRDLFYDHGGYRWESTHDGETYRSCITGSTHGDLRIQRIRTSFHPTIDPFGNAVQYKPLTRHDRQLVAAYHSCEPTLLTAVLKYIDQEKIDVPCLHDQGKDLLSTLSGQGQHIGNFGDFGMNETSARMLFFDYAFPMNDGHAQQSLFFHLHKEHEGAYRIHIDERRHLAFSHLQKSGRVSDMPSLTFPPEDMDHVVRGILTQAQQGKGRTSLKQLKEVLAYRYQEGFEDIMKNTRREILGE